MLSAGLPCHNLVRPHHLVVLVLEDVAVPDVTSGKAFEGHDDSCDHLPVSPHRVLPSSFAWRGRLDWAKELEFVLGLIDPGFVVPPIKNLETYQMQMDGVCVVGGVDEAPDFGAVQDRLFCDRLVPVGSVQQK